MSCCASVRTNTDVTEILTHKGTHTCQHTMGSFARLSPSRGSQCSAPSDCSPSDGSPSHTVAGSPVTRSGDRSSEGSVPLFPLTSLSGSPRRSDSFGEIDALRKLIQQMRTTIEVLESDGTALREENRILRDELLCVRSFYNPGEVDLGRNVTGCIAVRNRFDVLEANNSPLLPVPEPVMTNSYPVTGRRSTKRRNSIKQRRVLLLADSHGRDLGPLLSAQLGRTYESTALVRPGAPFDFVTKEIENLTHDFNFNDTVIVMGGTNDVVESTDQPCSLNTDVIKRIAKRTNVSVATIPFRYDKPLMNGNVNEVNQWLIKDLKNTKNLNVLDLSVFSISDYTNHGLHLNKAKGKYKLACMMSKIVESKFDNITTSESTPSRNLVIRNKGNFMDSKIVACKKDKVLHTSRIQIALESPREGRESANKDNSTRNVNEELISESDQAPCSVSDLIVTVDDSILDSDKNVINCNNTKKSLNSLGSDCECESSVNDVKMDDENAREVVSEILFNTDLGIATSKDDDTDGSEPAKDTFL